MQGRAGLRTGSGGSEGDVTAAMALWGQDGPSRAFQHRWMPENEAGREGMIPLPAAGNDRSPGGDRVRKIMREQARSHAALKELSRF